MIKSRSLLLILLLLTKCLNCDPRGPGDGRFRQSRFLDIPDFEFLDEAVGDVGRDFSQIYTGWVNSSFIYPYYLKGSTIVNDFYGSVNRTGLVIAGAALLGISGFAFLNELNAIPNVDGVANGVKGFQSFMDGMVSRFQSSIKSSVGSLASFKPNSFDITDRADVVYSLPGPPYNYDMDTVMNLTLNENLPNADRKSDIEESNEIVSIDKYFDDVDKGLATKNEIIDTKVTTEMFDFNQLEKPKVFNEYENILENYLNDDFEPSTLLFRDEPKMNKYEEIFTTNYNDELDSVGFKYNTNPNPYVFNQIENPIRNKYQKMKEKLNSKKRYPNKKYFSTPVTLNQKEYPMIKDVRNYHHMKHPLTKFTPSLKLGFPKIVPQKPTGFFSNRNQIKRKPYRRKENFLPKKHFYKKGFQFK